MPVRTTRSHKSAQSQLAAPLTAATVPPPPYVLAPIDPWMYSAILGNGRLLVCLSDSGTLCQLFYPSIDAGPHVRAFLLGIQVSGSDTSGRSRSSSTRRSKPHLMAGQSDEMGTTPVSWLDKEGWEHELQYRGDAAVIAVVSTNKKLSVRIEQTLYVQPDVEVLTNDIKVTNLTAKPIACRLVTYAGFDIGQRRSANCGFFDVETDLLTFFSGDSYFALLSTAPVDGFACDKAAINELDGIFRDADAGTLGGREYAIGQVSGAVRYNFGRIEAGDAVSHRLYLCCEHSWHEVKQLSDSLRETPPSRKDVLDWWQAQNTGGYPHLESELAAAIYRRSLMVLQLLTDRATGGIIAAPECDPDFRSCGGYGMCWPRDGAFVAYALDIAGRHGQARAFYEWALRVQEVSGVWYQRYYVDGKLAPSWGLVQFDETGAIVWAMCRHIQLINDTEFARKAYEPLVRACEYMHSALDSETGLAPITKDLWEERDGISTYASASTWGAFQALATLADTLGEAREAQRWGAAAGELKTAIETHLWDADRNRFLRGMKLKIQARDVERLRRQPDFRKEDITEIEVAGKKRYLLRSDATVDVATLGLSVPFGVFAADDPRMVSTAEAIFSSLTSPVGGILRYVDDHYRGGNPWIICTLWLAWQDLMAGNPDRAKELYTWVLQHCTPVNFLSEQVDKSTGKPCWVSPLGWSHAMFLLMSNFLFGQDSESQQVQR